MAAEMHMGATMYLAQSNHSCVHVRHPRRGSMARGLSEVATSRKINL